METEPPPQKSGMTPMPARNLEVVRSAEIPCQGAMRLSRTSAQQPRAAKGKAALEKSPPTLWAEALRILASISPTEDPDRSQQRAWRSRGSF